MMADEGWTRRPSPVLLVQQRHQTRQSPDKDREPSRSRWMHQLGLAQILGHLRQNIKQKAGPDATQNHFLHAAETKEPQRNGGRQQHHGGKYKGAGEELLVL